jgi:hypothetical protein
LIWETSKNYGAALPKDPVERMRVSYIEPVRSAAHSLSADKKDLLRECHLDILSSGKSYLARIIKKEGEDYNEIAPLRQILKKLQELTEVLE